MKHVDSKGYRRITGTSVDYDAIRDNVAYLYALSRKRPGTLSIHVKINDTGLTNAEKKKFIRDFTGISDSMAINRLNGWNNAFGYDFTLGADSREVSRKETIPPVNKERKVCPYPFYSMAVNFNGRVSACCADWSLGVIIGDAGKTHLSDIWNGAALNRLRILHLKGMRREVAVCSECQALQDLGQESDIDSAAGHLLKAYSRSQ